MLLRTALFLVLCGCLPAVSSQVPVGRLTSTPPLGPNQIAELEDHVTANPGDLTARLTLLRYYYEFAPAKPGVNPVARAARLQHILYLVENDPSNHTLSLPLAYVSGSHGPYADPADHELVRSAWIRKSNAHRADTGVQVNAARFLHIEHPEEATDLLTRAVEGHATDRRMATALGFLYAMDLVGLVDSAGTQRSAADRERLSARARAELERTNQALVIAATASALPNLFMRTQEARTPNPDRSLFEYSALLMARARQLAPEHPALHGPMPLIRDLEEFLSPARKNLSPIPVPSERAGGMVQAPPAPRSAVVRVGAGVQQQKLIKKPEPVYSDLALQARIQGIVQLNVTVGQDGTIENITVESGHPLLIPSAIEAVRRYRYQPTFLNGSAVKVITQVDVPFTLPQP